jgi:hypothetical protein
MRRRGIEFLLENPNKALEDGGGKVKLPDAQMSWIHDGFGHVRTGVL